MMAYCNKDVQDLNELTRSHLKQLNKLKRADKEPINLAVGERIFS